MAADETAAAAAAATVAVVNRPKRVRTGMVFVRSGLWVVQQLTDGDGRVDRMVRSAIPEPHVFVSITGTSLADDIGCWN